MLLLPLSRSVHHCILHSRITAYIWFRPIFYLAPLGILSQSWEGNGAVALASATASTHPMAGLTRMSTQSTTKISALVHIAWRQEGHILTDRHTTATTGLAASSIRYTSSPNLATTTAVTMLHAICRIAITNFSSAPNASSSTCQDSSTKISHGV